MSRRNANIPIAFANAPAPPGSEPTVNLDTDFSYVLGLIQDSANGFVNSSTDIGSANSYAVNLNATIAPSGYADGMTVAFLIANTNTAASTLNVNSLGTVPILTVTGTAVPANTLVSGNIAFVVYYAGNFYIVSVPFTTLNQDLGAVSAATSIVNCAGYNQVNISMIYTGSATPFVLTLNNLDLGAIITWVCQNNAASQRIINLVATYGPTAIGMSPIIAYGYTAASGFNQRINLSSGSSNTILPGYTMVFNTVVQTLATTPTIYGTIASGLS